MAAAISARPETQVLHQSPRRVDLGLGHPPIGFGDVAHELESRPEEHLRNAPARGRAGHRAEELALSEHETDEGADQGPQRPVRDDQPHQSPEYCTCPSHSR